MKHVVGIYKATGRSTSYKARDTLQAYAAAHGFGSDVGVVEVQDASLGSFKAALARLESGDVAIIPTLDDLGDTPSEIAAELQALTAKGIEVHSLDVGPVEDVQRVLRVAFGLTKGVEQRLAEQQAAFRKSDEEWARLFETFRRDTAAAFVKRFGVDQAQLGIPVPREVIEKVAANPGAFGRPAQAPDLKLIGQHIREARLARGWTQSQAGKQLEKPIDASAVSRAESTGEGPHVLPLLELVAPDAVLPEELQGVIDPLLFASQRIRVIKAAAQAEAADSAQAAQEAEHQALRRNGRQAAEDAERRAQLAEIARAA